MPELVTPQTFTALPAALLNYVQTNALERKFQDALRSKKAYRVDADQMSFPVGTGERIIKTRPSRKAPNITPMNPSNQNTALDNGVTPSTPGNEQYMLTLQDYGDSIALNLRQNKVEILSRFALNAQLTGEQGSQSLEWLCRNQWYNSYQGGDTRSVTANGTNTTTKTYVDDIRGFQNVMSNGVMQTTSSTYPLTAYVTGAAAQTMSITGVTADGTNVSTCLQSASVGGGGISGYLTHGAITTVTDGDRIKAINAPLILRAGGRSTTAGLTGSDSNKLGLLLDAKAYLNKQGAPKFADGTFHYIADDDSIRQLFDDPKFLSAYQGRYDSREYQTGEIFRLFGITFMSTNEALQQAANPSGTGAQAVNVAVKRPMLIASGGMIQGNFEANHDWLAEIGGGMAGRTWQVDDLEMILRYPIDNFQRNIVQSWGWGGDFCCPTDAGTTPSVTPTASAAAFKRAVLFEHAGQ